MRIGAYPPAGEAVAKRLNVVFDDESLYRALKVEAARRGVPAKTIVADALARWLNASDDEEDLRVSLDALADYRENGGLPAEQVHAEIDRVLVDRERASRPRRSVPG